MHKNYSTNKALIYFAYIYKNILYFCKRNKKLFQISKSICSSYINAYMYCVYSLSRKNCCNAYMNSNRESTRNIIIY
jgi:hypothetical protein